MRLYLKEFLNLIWKFIFHLIYWLLRNISVSNVLIWIPNELTRCSFFCLETAAKFVSLFSKDIGSVFCPHTFCSKIWTEYSSFVILFLILLFLFPPKIPFETFYRHVTGGIRYDDKKIWSWNSKSRTILR